MHTDRVLELILCGLVITVCVAAGARVRAGPGAEPAAPEMPQARPLSAESLRDVSICRGPDGAYYLTGTTATRAHDGSLDFENNDGIRLWRSGDLRQWEDLGLVWDMAKEAAGARHVTSEYYDVVPEIDGFLAHGMTAPEIHYLKATFWICYSMNGQGTALLKSKTGNAEGPYDDVGWITRRGGHPSMFEDADGAVYWLFNDAWIARMNPDLTALAEQPRLLRSAPAARPGQTLLKLGRAGAFLFRRDGRYYLTCPDYSAPDGKPSYDSFVAVADTVYGPYHNRRLLTAGAGPVSVVADGAGKWLAAFSRGDTPIVGELVWDDIMPALKDAQR